MKKVFPMYPLLIIGVLFVFISSCEKDDDEEKALFNSELTYGILTDQEGNVYKTITIGTQTWMAENLRTTTYNDGTAIPNIIRNNEWAYAETGAYYNLGNPEIYGRLYNWYTVNTGKLCPAGWHVPTREEWAILRIYLDDESVTVVDKLKEAGTAHWKIQNSAATNESGFTALPCGSRNNYGNSGGLGYGAFWWCASELGSHEAYACLIDEAPYFHGNGTADKRNGFSVRCVKD